jgi:hypothetical protein
VKLTKNTISLIIRLNVQIYYKELNMPKYGEMSDGALDFDISCKNDIRQQQRYGIQFVKLLKEFGRSFHNQSMEELLINENHFTPEQLFLLFETSYVQNHCVVNSAFKKLILQKLKIKAEKGWHFAILASYNPDDSLEAKNNYINLSFNKRASFKDRYELYKVCYGSNWKFQAKESSIRKLLFVEMTAIGTADDWDDVYEETEKWHLEHDQELLRLRNYAWENKNRTFI